MASTITIEQVADVMSLLYSAKDDNIEDVREGLARIFHYDESIVYPLDEHLIAIAQAYHLATFGW